MRVVAIDPGLTGAIGCLVDGKFAGVVDMPVGGNRVDASALANIIEAFDPDVVVVEDTQPMPKNGSIASFSLGLSTGIALGVASTLGHPVARIKPSDWKKKAGLTGKDKKASIHLARELWPTSRSFLERVKDADRAEALLIARAYIINYVQEANA